MAECIECGRTLKTGRKYCHIHRGFSGAPNEEVKKRFSEPVALIITATIMGFILSILGFMAGGIPMGLYFIVMTALAICLIIKFDIKNKEKKRLHIY